MDTIPTTSESRDGTGAGDHDIAFTWDTPRSYLTLMCQARLTIMRGLVMDYRRGERGGAADGDLSYTNLVVMGLHVPATTDPTHDPMPDEIVYDG